MKTNQVDAIPHFNQFSHIPVQAHWILWKVFIEKEPICIVADGVLCWWNRSWQVGSRLQFLLLNLTKVGVNNSSKLTKL